MNKPIIHLYTLCYNESFIIPFFLQHYLTFVDKIVVFDNYSNDHSVELFSNYENILVKSFDTQNEYREDIQTKIRNTIWKKSRGKAHFVIVCDLDEFLLADDFNDLFFRMQSENISIVKPVGYDMVSESLPEQGKPIYEQIREGVRNPDFDKLILFDPNRIEDMNFSVGSHRALPEGTVKVLKNGPEVKLLHYRYLSLEYMMKKHEKISARRGTVSKKNNWGFHYSLPPHKQKEIFEKLNDEKMPVI